MCRCTYGRHVNLGLQVQVIGEWSIGQMSITTSHVKALLADMTGFYSTVSLTWYSEACDSISNCIGREEGVDYGTSLSNNKHRHTSHFESEQSAAAEAEWSLT